LGFVPIAQGTYYFADSLEYAERDWTYCSDADRRFWTEQQSLRGMALPPPDTPYTIPVSTSSSSSSSSSNSLSTNGAGGSGIAHLGGGGPQLSDRVGGGAEIGLPAGAYDVGDGYYQPTDGKVYSYEVGQRALLCHLLPITLLMCMGLVCGGSIGSRE
jgi:hypothetical protein